MQTQDIHGNVLASKQIDKSQIAAEIWKARMNNKMASVTIGEMPLVGQEIELCGLLYSVTGRKGKEIKLKLKG